MYLRGLTSVETESISYKKKLDAKQATNPFERFFNQKEIKIRLAKAGCQLTELDGLCKFSHKSIQEYFVATTLFEHIFTLEKLKFDGFGADNVLLAQKPLVDEETDIYRFLIDQIEVEAQRSKITSPDEMSPLKQILLSLIERGLLTTKRKIEQLRNSRGQ